MRLQRLSRIEVNSMTVDVFVLFMHMELRAKYAKRDIQMSISRLVRWMAMNVLHTPGTVAANYFMCDALTRITVQNEIQ